MHTLRHFVQHRPRLTSAISIGVSLTLPSAWPWVTRSLVAWDVGVWLYLFLMAWFMTNTNHDQVCKIAQQEDKSALAVLLILSIAALTSLAAIILELASLKGLPISLRLTHYLRELPCSAHGA